mmetsp:Transcript_41917/g.98450  ORF Transcript_41917/g.98450 Transcript_41917/m.98450 type:complete len:753 (+) Transcript_41917:58-2316(+)
MEFSDIEASDGVRFSFNIWPTSRLEATRCVVPLSCMYSPLKKIEGMPVLPYEPIFCKGQCRSVLNPFCKVDYRARMWVCPFCFQRNNFPHHYSEISETNLPAELIPQYSTIEYELPRGGTGPPVFLLVVDTGGNEKELQALKDSLLMALNLIPQEAHVGLITFGTTVQVHELVQSDVSKCYVFRGTKDYTGQQVSDFLGLRGRAGPGSSTAAPPHARFIQQVKDCDYTLSQILEELGHDPWPVKQEERPLRCTGVAMSVAVGLLESTFPQHAARIMLFCAGPCTQGPGQIVGVEKSEAIRSHADIEKGKATYYAKACKYYSDLAQRLVNNSSVFDIFAASLDQCGVAELKSCVEHTGGSLVLTDSFTNSIFKESFKKLFARDENGDLAIAFCGAVEVLTSSQYFKVSGGVGCVSSLNKKSASVGETEIGQGGTCAWKMCGLDPQTSVAVFFEVTNQHNQPIPQGQLRYFQFVTSYQHSSGKSRLRVTTIAQNWAQPEQLLEISQSFDQEAAAVLMARYAVCKSDTEESIDVLRWLDRNLIRLVAKFGDYRKDDAASFRLSEKFSIYPQFMFHLRRSQFLHVFNSSPDETAFFRCYLLKETVTNCLTMIQPSLLCYSFSGPPVPVLLDVASISPDRILLLDTFFHVVVWHGDTIAQWRKQNYQEKPEYEHFKNLLQGPIDDANMIIRDRFPVPRYIDCDQYGSQARFLLAKVNPSSTHSGQSGAFQGSSEVIQTDDVSFQTFMDHLQRLAVQS